MLNDIAFSAGVEAAERSTDALARYFAWERFTDNHPGLLADCDYHHLQASFWAGFDLTSYVTRSA